MSPVGSRQAAWRALPNWARILTLGVGIPAWLFLGYGILSNRMSDGQMKIAFGIFILVCFVQIAVLSAVGREKDR